jgi:ATP-binding cassette subfamily C exporter for protease/lipase
MSTFAMKRGFQNRLREHPVISTLVEFRKEFLWVAVFSFVANLLTLSPTLHMLQVFDRVMVSQSELTLVALTLIIAGFIAVMAFAEWVRARLLVRAGIRFDEMLNVRIFEASFASNLDKRLNDTGKFFGDLTRLRQFLTGNGIIALFDLPWTFIYLSVLFLMHPLLGWFGIGFTVVLGLLAVVTQGLTGAGHEHASQSAQQASTYLAGKLRNAEVVHALGMLTHLRTRWMRLHKRSLQEQTQVQEVGARVQALSKFVQYVQQSLILSLGAWLVIRGEISMGAMVATNVLLGNALRPIGTLVGTWKEFVLARQSFNDLALLLEEHEPPAGQRAVQSLKSNIKLKQLSAFAHHREKPILSDITVDFVAGEVVGVVGPSGAGKSTLMRCLLGIWPRTSGSVLLDGVDIHQWSRTELGPRIGYLPQDIELFDGSVAENICRFGSLDPAAIIEAAKQADIHDMILRLPNGYDTSIGQAGRLLSAGQRQRLALARAIFGSPDLVVLDEPNANLDDAGEAALAKAITSLRQAGKTVFIVLHQRNLLKLADRVLVLTDGRVTQFGQLDNFVPESRTA